MSTENPLRTSGLAGKGSVRSYKPPLSSSFPFIDKRGRPRAVTDLGDHTPNKRLSLGPLSLDLALLYI